MGNIPRLVDQLINKVTISDVSTGGRLLSLDEISLNTGLDFNLATYLRLQESFFPSRAVFRAPINSECGSLSVSEFFNRFKKGTKSIRKVICKYRCANIRVDELNIVRDHLNAIVVFMMSIPIQKSACWASGETIFFQWTYGNSVLNFLTIPLGQIRDFLILFPEGPQAALFVH